MTPAISQAIDPPATFPRIGPLRREYKKRSQEVKRVLALALGEEASFKCRWTHGIFKEPPLRKYTIERCFGIASIRTAAGKRGIKIHAICKDGTLTIRRAA